MKPLQIFLVALLLSVATTCPAAIFDFNSGFQNGGVIADGNPAGWSDSRTISMSGYDSITSVSLTVNVTGGANGDLYAYLSYNGSSVTLLNRVGTGSGDATQQTWGFSTAGFNNIRLSDTGSPNIHGVANPEAYSLNATSYHPDSGLSNLSAFNGLNPNGSWTLFFADMAGGNANGNGPSTLLNWSLDVTAVPEPINVALGVFGVLFGALTVGRRLGNKRRRQLLSLNPRPPA